MLLGAVRCAEVLHHHWAVALHPRMQSEKGGGEDGKGKMKSEEGKGKTQNAKQEGEVGRRGREK